MSLDVFGPNMALWIRNMPVGMFTCGVTGHRLNSCLNSSTLAGELTRGEGQTEPAMNPPA